MTESGLQRRSVRRWFAALFLGVVLAGSGLVIPASASADDGDFSWAVQPSSKEGPDGRDRFEYTLKPGESVTDYVGVSNYGTKPLKMHVYPMDAITTSDGSFGIPVASVKPVEVGSWVGLTDGDGTYTIQPNTRIDIPFKITVPKDAIPGDHAGGIMASPSEPTKSVQEDSSELSVDRRVGTRIYITVPGERTPSMTVSEPRVDYSAGWNPISGKTTVSYDVTNNGNVRLSASVALSLDGIAGWHLRDGATREVADLLPGAKVTFVEEFTGVPPAVRLTAKVSVTPKAVDGTSDEPAPAVSSETSVWAFPWIIVIVLVVIILLVVLLIVRSRRLRKKLRALQSAQAPAETATVGGPPAV
ncbi:DUF916 domain-containing protein [Nakamurella silvestris]|nr:DUF916 domain-containing protein [Nakamurella silvestris]